MNITINLGQDTYISAEEILLVLYADTAPVKKLISDAKANDTLIDLRNRNNLKLRTVIVTKKNDIIISSLSARGLCKRYNDIVNKINTNPLTIHLLQPMIHIGFHNFIPMNNIYYFREVTSDSGQRITRNEKKTKNYYNITQASKTRTRIVLTNGEFVLTSIYSASLKERLDEAVNCLSSKQPYYAVAKFKTEKNSLNDNEDDSEIEEFEFEELFEDE